MNMSALQHQNQPKYFLSCLVEYLDPMMIRNNELEYIVNVSYCTKVYTESPQNHLEL